MHGRRSKTACVWQASKSRHEDGLRSEKSKKEVVAVSLEVWSIVTTGIVILIAIAASNRALRREISELRRETGEQIAGLRREMTEQIAALRQEMTEQVNALRQEMTEQVNALRQEMTEQVNALRQEMTERIDGLRQEMTERIDGVRRELAEQINVLRGEMNERMDGLGEYIGDVRERLGRVEGLQEALGFARRNPSSGKQRADKGPGDERRVPSQP